MRIQLGLIYSAGRPARESLNSEIRKVLGHGYLGPAGFKCEW